MKASSNLASRELYRRELVRQRDLLLGAWKAMSVMFIGMIALTFATPAPTTATLEVRLMGLATFMMAFTLIIKLNQLAAAKLTRRIETLDRMEPGQ